VGPPSVSLAATGTETTIETTIVSAYPTAETMTATAVEHMTGEIVGPSPNEGEGELVHPLCFQLSLARLEHMIFIFFSFGLSSRSCCIFYIHVVFHIYGQSFVVFFLITPDTSANLHYDHMHR
jgi:hypothetical protein